MIPILEHTKIAKVSRPKHSRMKLLALLLLVFSLVSAAAVAIYQLKPVIAANSDWSTYLHDPARSAASSDTILSPTNVGQLTLNWKFQTGGPVAASPTVVGSTMYVGSWDGYEYALDTTTGTMKWKTFLGQTTATCYPQLAGVSSSADVENGVVYVGGGDSNWYALDAATGNILWKVFIGDNTKGYYNWASPLIYNGYAYIGTASVGDCPLVQGQLLQVDLNTHQIIHSFDFVPQGQFGGGVWTSPSIDTATNTIYVTTGTRNQPSQTLTEAIVALDATALTLKSSWAIPQSQEVVDSDFGSTPIVFNDASGNQLVAAINKNGNAYAYNRNNVAAGPVWTQQIAIGGTCPQCGDGSASSGAFGNGTLFLAGGNIVINGQGYKGSVNAVDPATGKFIWQHGTSGAVVPALAYSNGLVIDGAGSLLEVLDASSGTRLYSYTTSGVLYAAPSVSNGRIFTGGTDGNVYAFGLPTNSPPPDPNCPNGWTCQDIGYPAPAGSETVTGNTWSVNAGGVGIGGASDQFRFIGQNVNGDTQISANVVSQQVTGGTAQAGLMVRQSSDPASPYYAIFLEPNNKLLVQYRLAFGGATTTVVQTNSASPPLYLEIQRVGDQFQAATSNDGVTYTLVPGTTMNVPMPVAVMEGIALSSGTQGTVGNAVYSNVNIQLPGTPPNPPASPTPCPANWNCSDIGNPALVGDQSLSGGTWTLKGAGTDINGTADQFHYTWQTLTTDGSVSARISSQTNTNPSAKAGVMLRESTDADSAYYAAFVTPSNGVLVQYRVTKGLGTNILTGPTSAVPIYLMIARSSSTYCTYTSADGVTWSYVIGTCLTLNFNSPTLAGIAVSSHNTGAISTATLDTLNISTTAPPPPTICPSGWSCNDIGYPLAGSQTQSGGTWSIQAAGSDIWGTADQFRYISQSLAADGSVSAHVVLQTNTDPWAKAGVMLRQSSDPGSAYYAVLVTPGNGIVVQYRTAQGANAMQSASLTGTTPTYLQVARSGSTYTAYTSSDGTTWTLIPGSSVTMTMSGSVLAGLAVTSHNASVLGSVTFDTVNVSTTVPPPPPTTCPSNWSCADIGNPALAGSQSQSGGTWSIQAAGGDIWGTADQFRYVSQSLAADGSVSAHVVSQTNTSPWAKAGVMLRQSSDPGSAFYAVFVTPGNGLVVQYRTAQGTNALQSGSLTGTAPIYVMVARSSSTYTAYTSSDGTTWTLIPGSSVTMTMSGSVLAGLAVTSHNAGIMSTVTFDTVNVSTTVPPSPGCLANWSCADIGNPTSVGSQSQSGGTWSIQAAGNDIWGTTDQFRYVSQSLAADGSVSAHVVSQTNTSVWAKAGVMLRQSSDPGSAYYAVLVTPGNGIVVQYRTAQGVNALQSASLAGTPPTYLMVARSGSTYTAYTSSDGTTWTPVAGSSVTMTMSGSVLAGLAVTSHNAGVLGSVTFDTVNVSTTIP